MKSKPLYKLKKDSLEVSIYLNQEQEEYNPRQTSDSVFKMYCMHRKYNLGDEQSSSTSHTSWGDMRKQLCKKHGTDVILPLYLYDHSGITMNTTGFSCRFDSGQVGWIVADRSKILLDIDWEYITKKRREALLNHMRNEVAEYDLYIRGNVFDIVLEANGEELETEDGILHESYEKLAEEILADWVTT